MQALCVDMALHVHFNPCFSPYKKKLLVKFICMATYCFFFSNCNLGMWASTKIFNTIWLFG